jgi:hypothetical protein
MKRKQNFQTISWFWDLYTRDRLNLDPPYQRRSVWNEAFKNDFIDTLLLNYPVPSIFLYEDITPEGIATFHVVDGKQRLTAIFEFVNNEFSVSEQTKISKYRGKYFKDLDNEIKKELWRFQFSVEYLPTVEESVVNAVFDRINRNSAYLTAQELRHAKFCGAFITTAEKLADWLMNKLPQGFPNITKRSHQRMKEVEFVAQLLLLLEEGPRGYSVDELDKAFSDRDQEWEQQDEIEEQFREITSTIEKLLKTPAGEALTQSRLKNQADFYSLFGALKKLIVNNQLASVELLRKRLNDFVELVDKEENRKNYDEINTYYEDSRLSHNQTVRRKRRIETLSKVLEGKLKDTTA